MLNFTSWRLEAWKEICAHLNGRVALLNVKLGDEDLRDVSPCRVAPVYLGLGDVERALEWFDKALRDQSLESSLSRAPVRDPLRCHPRFNRYFRAMNLSSALPAHQTDSQ